MERTSAAGEGRGRIPEAAEEPVPPFEGLLRACTMSAVHLQMRDSYTPSDPWFRAWLAGDREEFERRLSRPPGLSLTSGLDYAIKLAGGQSETANVIVQGGGTESVSVPAGTYRATLVTTSIVTKVGSLTSISMLKVWTAPGIGPVKTEQLLKAGGKTQVTTTTTLLSFTKQAAGS